MKIPKKIHWNGKDFTIQFDKTLDGGSSWGRTMISTQEIHLERDMHPQKQEQTFIHELLHIAFRGSGIGLGRQGRRAGGQRLGVEHLWDIKR